MHSLEGGNVVQLQRIVCPWLEPARACMAALVKGNKLLLSELLGDDGSWKL